MGRQAHHGVTGMDSHFDFSAALRRLKAGDRVQRAGWNGKGMWLVLASGGIYRDLGDEKPMGDLQPFIVMKTADDKFVAWLASQTDMLADDWQVVE